jgi:outer membrane lipoprotein carrier protein
MKKMKKIWIVLLFIMSVNAGDIVLPASFKADFVQTVTNTQKKVIRYEGKVYFSDQKHLKWAYVKPTKKEVCTDGREVLVVDHDLEQVSAYRIDKGLDLSGIIADAKPYRKDVYVTEYNGKQYTIQLDSRGHLQSVAFYDDLDNKVQILFQQMQYRRLPYPAGQMKCNYPADYDVIRG